jgi:hypothetical protein
MAQKAKIEVNLASFGIQKPTEISKIDIDSDSSKVFKSNEFERMCYIYFTNFFSRSKDFLYSANLVSEAFNFSATTKKPRAKNLSLKASKYTTYLNNHALK